MSKIYQAKSGEAAQLPHSYYRLCVEIIRAYPDLQCDLIYAGDDKLIGAEQLCRVVEEALDTIPYEYRQDIMSNIRGRVRIVDLGKAAERTYTRWKSTLILNLAKKLNIWE